MDTNNPYQSPEAALDEGQQGAYKPSVFSLNGRIGRARYFSYSLIFNISYGILAVLLIELVGVNLMDDENASPWAMLAFYLPAFAFLMVVAKRRLNDLNKNSWLALVMLIPLINIIPGMYLLFKSGSVGRNDYGLPEKKSRLMVVIAVGSILVFVLGILLAIALPAYQTYTQGAV